MCFVCYTCVCFTWKIQLWYARGPARGGESRDRRGGSVTATAGSGRRGGTTGRTTSDEASPAADA